MNGSKPARGGVFAAAICVAAALAGNAPAHAAISTEAAPLIATHVAWLGGWAALDGLQDLTLEGTIEVAGLKGTLSVQLQRGGRQRTAYDLKVMKGVEVIDGADAWELNPSGQVEDMGRDKDAASRRSLDRAFSRHLKGEGVEVSRLPDEMKDERTWAVLRFAYPDGDLLDLLVDAATGASTWTREMTDGREQWTRASDLREVGGVRLAFRQETLNEVALQNQTVTWTSAAVNTGLADDLFHRPGAHTATKLFRLPAGVTATSWLPLELYMERYIYMKGSLGGVPTDILLDSGAGITVLDQVTADKAGLKSTGALAAQGVGGTTNAGVVEGVTLQLGELTLGPLVAATLDLSAIEKRLGRSMPVILGKEVFHAMVVDIDYPNARIRFLEPAAFTGDGPGRRLEVLPGNDGHKLLKMSIEGLPEAIVSLDTGQGGALTLFRRYVDDNRLLEGRRTSLALSGGVGGTHETTMATLKTVTLAGYELRDVPTSFHRTDVGGAFDTVKLAGNLGAGILVRFRVVFDYSRDCLWLEPGAQFAAPQPHDRLGLTVQRDGAALVVEFVAPGSPAEAAGWRKGERITALEGAPIGDDWWRTWAGWFRAQDGTKVKLTTGDGTAREVVLAAYY